LVVHTPNLTGYTTRLTKLIPEGWRPAIAGVLQGRKPEDVYPTWYRANTVDVLRHLGDGSGLPPVTIRTVESSAQLYRVPVAGAFEEAWLKLIRSPAFSSLRPVLLAIFQRIG